MADLRVLIAAAGRGSRAGLPYPKTLYPVRGVPILLRIMKLFVPYDETPTVIVSPAGETLIRNCLGSAGYEAHLVLQNKPLGMGHAVLQFVSSPAFYSAEHILLVWGDIPFIQQSTISSLVNYHFNSNSDLTFATRVVDSPYTVVWRDMADRVSGVIETREHGITVPLSGERDIGLFVFRKEPVLSMLIEDLPGKYGSMTGEHGFLYVIQHLVTRGLRVEALPIATELDLVSLNSIQDLASY